MAQTRSTTFYFDRGDRWTWLAKGAISTEYLIDADTASLARALGLTQDAGSDAVLAALEAQVAPDPRGWFAAHGFRISVCDTWSWSALQ